MFVVIGFMTPYKLGWARDAGSPQREVVEHLIIVDDGRQKTVR